MKPIIQLAMLAGALLVAGCEPPQPVQKAAGYSMVQTNRDGKKVAEVIGETFDFPAIYMMSVRGHEYMEWGRGNGWFHARHCPCVSNEVRTITREELLKLNSAPEIQNAAQLGGEGKTNTLLGMGFTLATNRPARGTMEGDLLDAMLELDKALKRPEAQ